jgi:hypothetical protein
LTNIAQAFVGYDNLSARRIKSAIASPAAGDLPTETLANEFRFDSYSAEIGTAGLAAIGAMTQKIKLESFGFFDGKKFTLQGISRSSLTFGALAASGGLRCLSVLKSRMLYLTKS